MQFLILFENFLRNHACIFKISLNYQILFVLWNLNSFHQSLLGPDMPFLRPWLLHLPLLSKLTAKPIWLDFFPNPYSHGNWRATDKKRSKERHKGYSFIYDYLKLFRSHLLISTYVLGFETHQMPNNSTIKENEFYY